MTQYDVIVIGGGAAGMMCAVEAGKRGRRVLVIEHAEKVGKKILISGGGRCNFTNLNAEPEKFLSQNPHFSVSALTRYTQHDFIDLVKKHRIRYHDKHLGQLFCDTASSEIVQMLLADCAAVGVELRVECKVERIDRRDGYAVETSMGRFEGESLVIATGGPSIPKMGATGFAYDVARQFGLRVTETRPALVPFTLHPKDLDVFGKLSGVSFMATATCDGVTWRESVLFTHRGLSGPAVLQISSHWREGKQVVIDMLPDLDLRDHLGRMKAARPKAELKTLMAELLPKRIAETMCDVYLENRQIGQASNRELDSAAAAFKQWTLTPAGTEGYRTAEVTLGGVDTAELSSKTMEARKVPGLFFVGECVDVTGPLGGYNFQWAWSSGWVAGQSV
ncbi:MAG: NAD(P)/FAD-dependent oxidoreductase [SAR202 cluster bacterium]|nr:NAD(P)/FAD-dependent oxidoreductase [SAR202 cluster bacterium]